MFNLIEKENVNVRRLLAGRVLTNIADSLFYMAILWFFKVRFNSPVILSLIFIADSSIDMLSFTLGPLIDRIYIKKMLKIVTVVQIVTSVIATLLFQAKLWQNLTIWFLLAIYVISTIGSTLIYPAEEKILPVIVSKTKLTKVNGVFQMTYKTLDLFLNAAATLLITWVSLDFTVIISAVFFAGALAFYTKLILPRKLLLPESTSEYFTENYWQDLLKGWQTLKQEDKIARFIMPFAVTNLFYGISSVGLPYFATEHLTKSAIGYGSLELASSIGGLVGSMLIQRLTFDKNKIERLVVVCLALSGLAIVLEPAVPKGMPILLLILFFTSELWIVMMNINFEVLVQESFSPHVLGRVETINDSILSSMIPIGSFLGGLIVARFGADWAITLEGVAQILTAGYYFVIEKKK
ncbi:MFS transporter [Lactobacillus crispatus]|uniref:MFS transporter n=1 Tax=Lactobacillus crispatus TaxID=47770 RepID=UPI0030F701A2